MLSVYSHPNGSGIYGLPEVGAHGLLLYVGRQRPRFIATDEGFRLGEGYHGQKMDLRVGDRAIVSSAGSYLIVRRSGIIEMRSTPLLSWSLLPNINQRFMRAENINEQLVGGQRLWEHNREKSRVTATEQIRTLTGENIKLTVTKGYHDDGSVLQLLYEDVDFNSPKALYTGKDAVRKVLLRIGDVDGDTGKRLVLDVDDGMLIQSIGEKDDGTVFRQVITDHKDRDWRESTDIGLQSDGLVLVRVTEVDDDWVKTEKLGKQSSGVVHSEVVEKKTSDWTITRELGRQSGGEIFHEKIESISSGNVVEMKMGDMAAGVLEMLLNTDKFALTIKDDGQVNMSINAGALTIQIDASGNMTMDASGNVEATVSGHTHLTCSDIKLGSGSSGEQLVLGNLWMAHYNAFIAVFNAHQHIGNMGAPTGPPLAPGANMTTAQLSDKSRTEK